MDPSDRDAEYIVIGPGVPALILLEFNSGTSVSTRGTPGPKERDGSGVGRKLLRLELTSTGQNQPCSYEKLSFNAVARCETNNIIMPVCCFPSMLLRLIKQCCGSYCAVWQG